MERGQLMTNGSIEYFYPDLPFRVEQTAFWMIKITYFPRPNQLTYYYQVSRFVHPTSRTPAAVTILQPIEGPRELSLGQSMDLVKYMTLMIDIGRQLDGLFQTVDDFCREIDISQSLSLEGERFLITWAEDVQTEKIH